MKNTMTEEASAEMLTTALASLQTIADAHKRMADFCDKVSPIMDYCIEKMKQEMSNDDSKETEKLRKMRREREMYELKREKKRRAAREDEDAIEQLERHRRSREALVASLVPEKGMIFDVAQDAGPKFPGFTKGSSITLHLVDCADRENSYSDRIQYVFRTEKMVEVVVSEREFWNMLRHGVIRRHIETV